MGRVYLTTRVPMMDICISEMSREHATLSLFRVSRTSARTTLLLQPPTQLLLRQQSQRGLQVLPPRPFRPQPRPRPCLPLGRSGTTQVLAPPLHPRSPPVPIPPHLTLLHPRFRSLPAQDQGRRHRVLRQRSHTQSLLCLSKQEAGPILAP